MGSEMCIRDSGHGISEELTNARLNLVVASRQGLKVGLDLLGVSAPNKM